MKNIRLPKEILFTPGPLTTDIRTRMEMLNDFGSRERDFSDLLVSIISQLKKLAALPDRMECVLMQGPSTFSLEAVIGTLIKPDKDKLLVLVNGEYGRRMYAIAKKLRLSADQLVFDSFKPIDIDKVRFFLDNNPEIGFVAMVHCETSYGVANPMTEIAMELKKRGIHLIVDGVSAFGALPVDLSSFPVAAYVISPNKCLEGVPGFGIIFVSRVLLERSIGNSPSVSLDIYDQWQEFQITKQFRFTPPTHALAAFSKALDLLEEEGGIEKRSERYRSNMRAIAQGMEKLGFQLILNSQYISPVILSFSMRNLPLLFDELYVKLKSKGYVVYPCKSGDNNALRVGCIGAINVETINLFLIELEAIIQQKTVIC